MNQNIAHIEIYGLQFFIENWKTLAYYDIMREGITKASAIERLAGHLGIKKG